MATNEFKQAMSLLFSSSKRTPGQLIIQMADACNATCPQCELRVTSKFKRSRIPLDDLKRIIDKAAENGVTALSFTGGEPFLFENDLIEAIKHAGRAGIPYIRTGSNAYFLCDSESNGWETKIAKLADRLADTPLYTLWFSLDSCDSKTHQKMRGLDGVVKGMERALPIFHERGIFPSANLGINRNTGGADKAVNMFDCGVEEFYHSFFNSFDNFYRKVGEIGFTIVNACYPMSADINTDQGLGNVYGAASSDDVVTFTKMEKAILFQALFDAIGKHRDHLRIFSPKTSLHMLIEEYSQDETSDKQKPGYPCRGGIDYFFIDAQTQETWPCGFRSDENLGHYTDLNIKELDCSIDCRKCDWECFRDPSELLGPLSDIKRNPFRLLSSKFTGSTQYQLWQEDLKYYRACGYFNGREKPNYFKMEKFHKEPQQTATLHTLRKVRELFNQKYPKQAAKVPTVAIYYSNNRQELHKNKLSIFL